MWDWLPSVSLPLVLILVFGPLFLCMILGVEITTEFHNDLEAKKRFERGQLLQHKSNALSAGFDVAQEYEDEQSTHSSSSVGEESGEEGEGEQGEQGGREEQEQEMVLRERITKDDDDNDVQAKTIDDDNDVQAKTIDDDNDVQAKTMCCSDQTPLIQAE